MHLSFQKIFYALAAAFLYVAALILTKDILIPLVFALLLAFVLLPLALKFEQWGASRIFATFYTLISVFFAILGVIFFFSSQLYAVVTDITDIKDKILIVLADGTLYANSYLNLMSEIDKESLINGIKNWFATSMQWLLGQTFSSSASFLSSLFLTVVYTFLLLIYRSSLTHAVLKFYETPEKSKALQMLKSIQIVGKKYLSGLLIIVLVLGFLNSIGLYFIKIEHPFLFGFFAALLAIIPYIGTLAGALIPMLYAFVAYDSMWMPVQVAGWFWFIQLLESNILSPQIVGGSLKVNALVAILSILIGAAMWGLAGMILFLPLTAMFKVVCEHYPELQPIGLLIGEQNKRKNAEEISRREKWRIKIKSWFSKNKKTETL
jgi:predicted PurR-regulated permease PerM